MRVDLSYHRSESGSNATTFTHQQCAEQHKPAVQLSGSGHCTQITSPMLGCLVLLHATGTRADLGRAAAAAAPDGEPVPVVWPVSYTLIGIR